MKLGKVYVYALLIMLFAVPAYGFQELAKDSLRTDIRHTSKGFQFTSADNKFQLQVAGRLQLRFATPMDQDPETYNDFTSEDQNVFKINRARLKVGGHAYQPWLKYYFEYDLSVNRLLDFRVMVEKWPWLKFKAGQWKIEYTRERSISSGKQQMLERSLINRAFTLDRQQGVSVFGRIDQGGLADFNYHLSVLTGTGLGAKENDDKKLMYVGKVFWNVLGDGVDISGSDLVHYERPHASLAIAAATNTSPYTRFSSSGGGELVGFEDGTNGQYQVKQWVWETALKYKSFSWQSEVHRKYILNHENNIHTELQGFYVQGGYVLNHQAKEQGRPLFELAGRYSYYEPRVNLPQNSQEEYGVAFNCFFNEHLNKLTADVTYFDFDELTLSREISQWRFRVQYDISF
ncbi:hypothetical protein GCM10007049_38520 [Echinicola pacifica]|uniref:Phosphate-selective porin O and P n=1 Tax=Echinicola pacifica TaxID=346377 RepID=A0A918QC35_9BACT|nr:porin [Echinicola pacifica]GGZ41506.1 hypothetical protein GCM10007049_38520 [Echinicola pacifica]